MASSKSFHTFPIHLTNTSFCSPLQKRVQCLVGIDCVSIEVGAELKLKLNGLTLHPLLIFKTQPQNYDLMDHAAFASRLVLDLDETLVHTTPKRAMSHFDAISHYRSGLPTNFHVAKRPFLDTFFQHVCFLLIPDLLPPPSLSFFFNIRFHIDLRSVIVVCV